MEKKLIEQIINSYSPSGYENISPKNTVMTSDVFIEVCSKFGELVHKDNVGNVCFCLGNKRNANKRILISAHIDEIAMQVQRIDDNGFIHFISHTGIDEKVILGSVVDIITKQGIIKGVIGKKPIHVEKKTDGYKKTTTIEDMKIDCGFETKEEASSFISVGDCIVVKNNVMFLNKNRFTASGIDDKAGLCVVCDLIERLHSLSNTVDILSDTAVYFAAVTQEECSASGAANIAKLVNPTHSIDFDVTFATDDEYVSKNEWGDIKLDGGAAICHCADCNSDFVDTILDCAKECNIKYQEFAKKSGGTNTKMIKQNSFDCKTAFIAIPNRNMHTQVEMASLFDMCCISDIVLKVILKLDTLN